MKKNKISTILFIFAIVMSIVVIATGIFLGTKYALIGYTDFDAETGMTIERKFNWLVALITWLVGAFFSLILLFTSELLNILDQKNKATDSKSLD